MPMNPETRPRSASGTRSGKIAIVAATAALNATWATAQPTANETWFGVWVRVQNEGDKPLPAADTWEIVDTQDNTFRPIPIDTEANVFAFKPGIEVPANTVLPLVSSAAGQGPIQGSLLLFKLKTDTLQNRPLQLKFSNGQQGEQGTYDIDV